MLKIISNSLPGLDLFKQAKTGPKYLVRLVPGHGGGGWRK